MRSQPEAAKPVPGPALLDTLATPIVTTSTVYSAIGFVFAPTIVFIRLLAKEAGDESDANFGLAPSTVAHRPLH